MSGLTNARRKNIKSHTNKYAIELLLIFLVVCFNFPKLAWNDFPDLLFYFEWCVDQQWDVEFDFPMTWKYSRCVEICINV